MDVQPVGDLALGPADVVAGVLVGGVEVQHVDGAGHVVSEAELLLLRVGRRDALPSIDEISAGASPNVSAPPRGSAFAGSGPAGS